MRMFLGILLAVLGVAAAIIVFTPLGVGMTMFWRVAHVIAGVVLVVAAVPMFQTRETIENEPITYNDRI